MSLDSSLRQCLADEKGAPNNELEKQWTQFSPALRDRCVATTETGGNPSYVEVLVCLQIGRDADGKALSRPPPKFRKRGRTTFDVVIDGRE